LQLILEPVISRSLERRANGITPRIRKQARGRRVAGGAALPRHRRGRCTCSRLSIRVYFEFKIARDSSPILYLCVSCYLTHYLSFFPCLSLSVRHPRSPSLLRSRSISCFSRAPSLSPSRTCAHVANAPLPPCQPPSPHTSRFLASLLLSCARASGVVSAHAGHARPMPAQRAQRVQRAENTASGCRCHAFRHTRL
jgi:hypothetical protein